MTVSDAVVSFCEWKKGSGMSSISDNPGVKGPSFLRSEDRA